MGAVTVVRRSDHHRQRDRAAHRAGEWQPTGEMAKVGIGPHGQRARAPTFVGPTLPLVPDLVVTLYGDPPSSRRSVSPRVSTSRVKTALHPGDGLVRTVNPDQEERCQSNGELAGCSHLPGVRPAQFGPSGVILD